MLEHLLRRTTRCLDLPCLALSTVSLFALTWALIEGHDRGWTSAGILGAFAVAAISVLAFVVIERRVEQPMVDVTSSRGASSAEASWP